MARSQLFHVHIEYERRNQPKRSRFSRLESVGFGAHRSACRFQSIVAFESVPVEEVYALHRPYMISSVPKLVFFSP